MAYCEWLFTILLKASKEIDVSDYDAYHKRVYGFLSEPLLKVYVEHHQLKVKEHGVVYTSEKAETMELKLAVGQLLRMGQASEAQQLFQEFVKLRPDVKLPASDIKRELPCIELLLYIIQMEQQYGVECLYTDTKELGELIEHLQWIREWIRKEKEQEELGQELQEKLKKIHISSVAKEIISLNLEF